MHTFYKTLSINMLNLHTHTKLRTHVWIEDNSHICHFIAQRGQLAQRASVLFDWSKFIFPVWSTFSLYLLFFNLMMVLSLCLKSADETTIFYRFCAILSSQRNILWFFQVIKVNYVDAVILDMFHTCAFTIILIIGLQW